MDQKPMGRYIRIDGNKATVSGIDNGPNVTVEALNEDCIVLKFGGHSYWSGIGMQSYAATERAVFRIVRKRDDIGGFEVEPLISYPTRREAGI